MASKKDLEYEAKVLAWRAEKYKALVQENGWLALAGLYWLTEGRNLVGANPMCEVILPDRAPTFLGVVLWQGKTFRFTVAEGVRVKVNGKLVEKALLKSTREAKPSFVTWNDDLRFVIHTHAGHPAIRVWDNKRPARFSLPPLKWFPVNQDFRFKAKYTRYAATPNIQSEDTFGEMVEDRIDGFVTFKYQGVKYKLDASENREGKLFIKFRDETSRKESYPPSRYHYTPPVGADGKVALDLNFSYNPPCAFTEYATCIYAPPQNTLPFRVEAGEIYRGEASS